MSPTRTRPRPTTAWHPLPALFPPLFPGQPAALDSRLPLLITLVLALAAALPFAACRGNAAPADPGPSAGETGWRRPQVLDAHTHLSPYAIPVIRRILDENGIEAMVNVSGGNQADEDLYYSAKLAKLLPGRIINCYTPDWMRTDAPDFAEVEARRLEESVRQFDFRCLKIAKALGLFVRHRSGVLLEVDDPALDPLWAAAGRLDVPVYVHVADPKAFFQPCDATNERWKELSVHPHWCFHGKDFPSFDHLLDAFERVVARHPETTFIGVHFGNDAEEPDRVNRMLTAYPNYFIDTAARVPEFGRHDAKRMHDFFVKWQDRIVFGTDTGISPRHLMLGSSGDDNPTPDDARKFFNAQFRYFETWDKQMETPTPIQGDWKIDGIGLPPPVLEKLYRKNLEKLLKITKAAEPASPARPGPPAAATGAPP